MQEINSFSGQYNFLSNFYLSRVSIGSYVGPSVEHLYQMFKTKDKQERLWVLESSTPAISKKRGKLVTIRDDWEDIKINVMTQLVFNKFAQNDVLRKRLIETGNAILIEGNWWSDRFWGVCKGVGENHLGQILMKVRTKLVD